ncbi:MAG: DUF3489 domain-containing protein [Mesorhizobium sp.]
MAIINIPITANANVEEQVLASEQNIDQVETKPGKATKPHKSKALTANPETKRLTATDGKAAKQKTTSHQTKADGVLKKLHHSKGLTLKQLIDATGWQAHSVRGFLSAVVRKKLGLTLVSEIGKDGLRRYRINSDTGMVA